MAAVGFHSACQSQSYGDIEIFRLQRVVRSKVERVANRQNPGVTLRLDDKNVSSRWMPNRGNYGRKASVRGSPARIGGELGTFLTKTDICDHKCLAFVHKRPCCGFWTVPLLARRTWTLCRVQQSIGGAERSSSHPSESRQSIGGAERSSSHPSESGQSNGGAERSSRHFTDPEHQAQRFEANFERLEGTGILRADEQQHEKTLETISERLESTKEARELPKDGFRAIPSYEESSVLESEADDVSKPHDCPEALHSIAEGTTSNQEQQNYNSGPDWDEEIQYVTRISVPREKYIPVAKVDLVNDLLLSFFPEGKDSSKFLSICSYLELILHAEHKVELEKLRADYRLIHSVHGSRGPEARNIPPTGAVTNVSKLGPANSERAQKQATIGELGNWPAYSPDQEMDESDSKDHQQLWKAVADLRVKLLAAFKKGETDRNLDTSEGDSQVSSGDGEARDAALERFQKNFLKMLTRAEFEGISARDLELTAALNSDYLLTLPVDVDWKRTAAFNVRIFRRGYTKEEQTGLLLGEKVDYLQSLLLRKTFKGFAGPLINAGRWCIQKWEALWEDEEGRALAESVSRWLQEPSDPPEDQNAVDDSGGQPTQHETMGADTDGELDMPIWLAARQAVPRYEAVLSSAGSRGLLIRRILVRMGLLQPESPSVLTLEADEDESSLEPHLRPSHLSRVSMKDIWLPASNASVGHSPWRIISGAFSVFFSKATLQEPAFQELVLMYNANCEGEPEKAGLQLQTYKGIPLPDLKIVFPGKKLIFRVLDTVRLDITSIAGLLAYTVNYRFDDLSSPSAFLLDLIASSALVVFVSRVAFGYKQVWDRYQLLVNKTLSEKTMASGFGVVQFLLDESEEQQFKEAILVFMILTRQGTAQGMSRTQLTDACERFLYYRCKAKVRMPVESAINTLLKFGLISVSEEKKLTASLDSADVCFKALPCDEGLRALEQHWVSMPSSMALWTKSP